MSLELNKIAAAVLVSGLVAMITGKVADGLYHPDTHIKKRGYAIAVDESAEAGSAQKEPEKIDIAAFLASASAEKGKSLTKPCTTCHTFEKGGADGVGPNLYGILGHDIASKGGYAYSEALQKLEGNWDFDTLSDFLTKPAKFAPGTKMSFFGIAKPEDRAAVLLYLNSMSDASLPLPAPKAAAEAVETPEAPTDETQAESETTPEPK